MTPAGGTSTGATVLPIRYVQPGMVLGKDLDPHVKTLSTSPSPSARMTAAKALSDGRHGSTDLVKGILFQAVQSDPCPAVRAHAIELLCKLGYYNPAFLDHLRRATQDTDGEVQTAAKAALQKMSPRR